MLNESRGCLSTDAGKGWRSAPGVGADENNSRESGDIHRDDSRQTTELRASGCRSRPQRTGGQPMKADEHHRAYVYGNYRLIAYYLGMVYVLKLDHRKYRRRDSQNN